MVTPGAPDGQAGAGPTCGLGPPTPAIMGGGRSRIAVIMSGVPERPIPPADDLLKLALAAFSNAKDLLAAAGLLTDAGSFPPAHTLATFAAEEQGKSQLCFMVIALAPFGVDPAVFWDEFYTHQRKLTRVRGFDGLALGPLPASAAKFIRSLPHTATAAHKRRLRGLFVDYQDDGGLVLLPSDIGEQETRALMADVQRSLDFAERAFAPLANAPDAGREFAAVLVGNQQLPGLLREASQVLHAADPAVTLPALRQWFQAQLDDPPDDIAGLLDAWRAMLHDLQPEATDAAAEPDSSAG